MRAARVRLRLYKPNAVWSADHEGWFLTKDKMRCEPLTVMDSYRRSVLGLEALGSTGEDEVWLVFGFSEGRRGGFGGDGEREGASLAELA